MCHSHTMVPPEEPSGCTSIIFSDHPVTDFGYRVEGDGRVMFFTGDHEPWVNIYGPDDPEYPVYQQTLDQRQAEVDKHLFGIDLLVVDASYTEAEYKAGKTGWGHGTFEGHIAWGRRLGVRRLVCTHHEPTRSDDQLEKVFGDALAAAGYPDAGRQEPEILLAREGLEILL